MQFKGTLITPVILSYQNLAKESSIYFTDSQIIFPKDYPFTFQSSAIKHLATYELLTPKKDIHRINRYRIRLSDGKEITLGVDNNNEVKLKWIHKIYEIQKDYIKTITLIVAILGFIAMLIGLLTR